MPLSEGSKVGPYEVVAPLGAGGMGEVWRARDPRLGRDVALKVLPDEMVRDTGRIARFRAEARAASALNHPNIVTVYDIGEEGGRTYLSMELLEGVNLRQLLDGGALPLSKALQIASQIAEGLAAAHARGIVHRDLKPENVILTTDNVVKILDFGLAKTSPLAGSHGDSEPTMSAAPATEVGTLLGTVGYMSPEQASGSIVDFRSDQFSFGTILYELVTGRRAWRKATPAETLVAIMREDPPLLSSAESPIPARVRRVVGRCLAKGPDERYSATRDLARDVRYLAEQTSDAHGPSDLGLTVEPPPRARRRLATPAVLGIVALAALAALGAALWIRRHQGPAPIESLAVLPFENGTHEPENEYLSDGITESLIDQMSRVPALRVMARATVFRFKGSADPQEAGRKLGVGAVLTGRISRQNERLSISAELMDVASGARLWGETFERPAADLLRVQNEIASDISAGLRLRLTEPEKRALNRHGTEDSEAYELFLKARYAESKDTEEGYLQARRLFLQAVEKDPRFARAQLGASDTYGLMAMDGYIPPAEAWAGVNEGARKALALDPGFSEARAALAIPRFFSDWDWAGAEREFREAGDGPGPIIEKGQVFALLLWARGRTDEALAVIEKARRIDPGNLSLMIDTADYLAKAGRFGDAIGRYRAAMEADPSDPRAWFGLAEVLRRQGDMTGAIAALRKAYELTGEDDGVKALAAASTEQDYENAQVTVARARLTDTRALAKGRYVSPLDLARLEAQLGEKEKAFQHLEAAFVERSPGMVLLKVDSAWDRIRDDARFGALVKRVGIP
ncbi:MAG: protein kinase [Thermoanaerobaculia bacterium]